MSYRPRPSSPTGTSISGISNYRSDSYRPIREREVPAVPQIDSKKIARIHFDELQSFLASHLAKEVPNARSSAREKLTRLTRQQFQELSTDVYDELIRRNDNSESPHLPNRDDFHPKRNQARQKLATLPKPRFKDLASDVYFELGRRYPEFKEPELLPDTPESAYEEFPTKQEPAPDGRMQPNGIGGPVRRPSDDNYRGGPAFRRPTPDQPFGRRSEENNRPFGRQPSQASRDDDGQSTYSAARRRPSNDTDGQYARKPLESVPPGPSSATSDVVIPNKSTIAEEEIQVPYGRDSRSRDSNIRDSVVTVNSGNRDSTGTPPDTGAGAGGGLAAMNNSKWDKSPVTPLQGGLNALAAGFNPRNDSTLSDDEESRNGIFDNSTIGGRARSASGSSNATRRKIEPRGGMDREETEKMRKDYEYRITSLQNRVASLQDEVDQATKSKRDDQDRIRELTDEISSVRNKQSEQASALREAERRLADERTAKETAEKQRDEIHRQEIRRHEQRIEALEREKSSVQTFGDSTAIIEDLKSQMEELLEEVQELATRNEELSSAQEADAVTVRDLEDQVVDYKKKYERAKTELRNLKATSQLFLQRPKNEDQLPTSPNGAITDVHITAFQSAADDLLSTGRSEAPSRVLTPVKAIVDAVSAIIEDARSYDLRQRASGDPPVDYNTVEMLCERTQATLSNLVTASKTHATSYGLSPVSLLDAALSHVSASVTELAKTLFIRRSPREIDNGFGQSSSNGRYGNTLAPVTRPSMESYRSRDSPTQPRGLALKSLPMNPKDISERSSSNSSSPPALFDEPGTTKRRGIASEESTYRSGSNADAWSEVQPYLETQSDQLVQAIQGVLTAVRNPNPSPELSENLDQIVVIVSSIVAVSRDSLPPSSQDRGAAILRTLTEHCDKLSEVQAQRNVTKEARGTMAQSSFAIASAVKELMKL